MMPRCVPIAPFGRPVVPEVYMMNAVSSSLLGDGPADDAGSLNSSGYGVRWYASHGRRSRIDSICGHHSGLVRRTRAPEFWSMNSSSVDLGFVLGGTAMAPSWAQASTPTQNGGPLLGRGAGRQPGLRPRPR